MNRLSAKLAGAVLTAALVACFLLLVLPAAYAVGVLRRTGSRVLFGALCLFVAAVALALFTRVGWLFWLSLVVGVAMLAVARYEQVRLGATQAGPSHFDRVAPWPLGENHW